MGRGIRRAVLGVVAAVAVWGEARAETSAFINGNELHEYCNSPRGTERYGLCVGYIVGVSDALASGTTNLPVLIFGWRACIPKNVTIGQVTDVVTKWLREHPQDRHYLATGIVAEALAKAFPCK